MIKYIWFPVNAGRPYGRSVIFLTNVDLIWYRFIDVSNVFITIL